MLSKTNCGIERTISESTRVPFPRGFNVNKCLPAGRKSICSGCATEMPSIATSTLYPSQRTWIQRRFGCVKVNCRSPVTAIRRSLISSQTRLFSTRTPRNISSRPGQCTLISVGCPICSPFPSITEAVIVRSAAGRSATSSVSNIGRPFGSTGVVATRLPSVARILAPLGKSPICAQRVRKAIRPASDWTIGSTSGRDNNVGSCPNDLLCSLYNSSTCRRVSG